MQQLTVPSRWAPTKGRDIRLRERAAPDEREAACGARSARIGHRSPQSRHPGYGASQRILKRIEKAFGLMKTIGGMRRPMRRGTERVEWSFTFVAAAYNLIDWPSC